MEKTIQKFYVLVEMRDKMYRCFGYNYDDEREARKSAKELSLQYPQYKYLIGYTRSWRDRDGRWQHESSRYRFITIR